MPELKVGTRIDIVFENEMNKSNAHDMKALVYDYERNDIIVSQTSPPLNRNFINRRILVTFLGTVEKRVLRFGFSARLIDLIADYEISSNNTVEALVLKKVGSPEQVDFRMHFRVKPPSQSDVSLFFNEEKVNLIDISLGGAKFTYPKSHSFLYGDTVNLKLTIGSASFNLNAKVRNILSPSDFGANKSLQYIGVEFEHDDNQIEAALGRAIIGIERQMLSEGKIN